MKKKSRFQRSQNAHRRLERKHSLKSNGNNTAFVKMNYHSSVLHRQQRLKRVLSFGERKKVYDDVIKTFF